MQLFGDQHVFNIMVHNFIIGTLFVVFCYFTTRTTFHLNTHARALRNFYII